MPKLSVRALRGAALAALFVTAACHPATATQSACAAPPAWPEPGAKRGQPERDLEACLRAQAYEVRNLSIPVVSATAGIIAQCEVRVDRYEGSLPANDADREATTQQARPLLPARRRAEAAAEITLYRMCVGK